MNMIMESTSLMPHFTLRMPTIMPHTAPATAEASTHRGTSTMAGAGTRMPTTQAAMLPTTNWPSAPMLNTPVRNENATERPRMISGVAYTTLYERLFAFAKMLVNNLP